MGLLAAVTAPVVAHLETQSTKALIGTSVLTTFLLAVFVNVLLQLTRARARSSDPPVVFHWVPFIGSTVTYGIDPYKFFDANRKKYGDVFTFILLGKKTTVCLGTKGNDFILNGKLKDVNAEEIYSPLTTPVFGKDVVYDCPNAKLMEQKKFVKFGLTAEALRSYVELIAAETKKFADTSRHFTGARGSIDLPAAMAELTIYTASRSLQGKEVREKFDKSFADLYHDLDMGFTPINFMLPWAPLPQNRRRDAAQRKMTETYLEIVTARRKAQAAGEKPTELDMIWNLMSCQYKDGTDLPDREIAHMMIALLMAGQHSSSSTISWIILRLASRPELFAELLAEQRRVLGDDLPALTHDDLARLPLHAQVVKETLRLHSPIHSIMRAVKSPMPVDGSQYIIPVGHTLLAAPGVTSKSAEYFPEPLLWEPHRWDADADGDEADSAVDSNNSSKDYKSLRPIVSKDANNDSDEKTDYGYGLVSKGAASPYLPFGAGRHRCIGEQFAYVQLQTILATLAREFEFRNVGGSREVVGTDYSSLFSRPLAPAVVEWRRLSDKARF